MAGTKIGTFGELLGPRMVAKGAAATAKLGIHQGMTIGHPAQLGGVLVIRPGDEIVVRPPLGGRERHSRKQRGIGRRAGGRRHLDARERPLLHSVATPRGGAVR